MPKSIKSKTRIPTLIGLVLLFIALTLGTALYFYQDAKSTQKRVSLSPKNIEVINITDRSATVTWKTDLETKGEIILKNVAESDKRFYDDRDKLNPKDRNTHYVSLQNLTPQTQYSFKIIDGNEEYQDPKIQSFKTANALNTQDLNLNTLPLTGAVIDGNLNPVEGALVFLNISGASRVGVFTNSEGNFILPIKPLLKEDLSGFYNIKEGTNASLQISKNNLSSIIEFTFPLKNSSFQTLPLGRNINLRDYLANTPEPVEAPKISKEVNYDLNSDGKINSVDLSIVVQNFGKRTNISAMDFNSDSEVNQKDIELLLKSIPN